ncbi:LytR/AlgR family response regulator transcription factor [Pedobacter sp. MW01-1-1]|uniref:LytR/AlgR family response regulator transcription factor n=1 Tax=Pedobacter sp. MW01-1-1 TaxID=3383027 RepID=UPI003FED7FD7
MIIVSFLFSFAPLAGIVLLAYFLLRRFKGNAITPSQNNVSVNFSPPIQTSSFSTETQKEDPFIKNTKFTLALPQQNEIRYVTQDEIIRCESDNNYTNFIFVNGDKLLISKPLKEYADLLRPQGFLRSHQSHLVNPTFVKSWLKEDGGVLLMRNGDKIPVSKPNREIVKEALENVSFL